MSRSRSQCALLRVFMLALFAVTSSQIAMGQVQRDAQAVSLVGQALTSLAGGTAISAVTLQAATYIAGSDRETGSAAAEAKGIAESRIDLSLSGGMRQEIRNSYSGQWTRGGIPHLMATHNCWVGPGWFFPALSVLASLSDPEIAVVYLGQETVNGQSAHHVQFYRVISSQSAKTVAMVRRLSTQDVYLDPASFLPVVLRLNLHPDNNGNADVRVEIRFSDYRLISQDRIPFRIQKLVNNALTLDLAVAAVALNPTVPDSDFTIVATQ